LPPTLSNRQRTHLRQLGHHIDPIVQVGKDGVTEGLCAALEEALDRHELVKIRLSENVPGDRHELGETLAEKCSAALVQTIGRIVLLYRRRPDSDTRPHIPLTPTG
jgi:RNA-binding protein